MNKIGIIGCGAMGGALVRGLLAAGVDAGRIVVATPHPGKVKDLMDKGVRVFSENTAVFAEADAVVVAVKPWILPDVMRGIVPGLDAARQTLSIIAASVSVGDLRTMLSGKDIPTSLVMPNTAMALGRSMTFVVDVNAGVQAADEIFGKVGEVMAIEERMLPAATALASCGIAYALRYVRAATEGGVQMGFRAADAQRIVSATIAGASALLEQPGAHAEAEIDKVTTPGGLTIRGLNAMEREGFTNAVIAGLLASTQKD